MSSMKILLISLLIVSCLNKKCHKKCDHTESKQSNQCMTICGVITNPFKDLMNKRPFEMFGYYNQVFNEQLNRFKQRKQSLSDSFDQIMKRMSESFNNNINNEKQIQEDKDMKCEKKCNKNNKEGTEYQQCEIICKGKGKQSYQKKTLIRSCKGNNCKNNKEESVTIESSKNKKA